MIIAVEDTSYRCKNCDSFGQCEYYHHRRPDSHICKEFRNDWRQRDVLDKIKDYVDHIRNTGLGKKKSLDFIEKYIDGLKAESKDPNDMTRIFDGVTEIPKDAFKGWTTEELLEQIREARHDREVETDN